MKYLYKLITFLFLFTSCSLIGTKTIYKTNQAVRIRNIGILEICDKDLLNNDHSNTDDAYVNAIIEYLSEYSDETIFGVRLTYPCTIDTIQIKNLCKLYNLDGYIISNLKFLKKFSFDSKNNSDSEIEIKLYSKECKLMLSTKHNTYWGNSYLWTPKKYVSIDDAIKGAIKRLVKELKSINA